MTKYLTIFLLLVAASSACAQLKEDDDWFIKKKKQASITTSGGTSVTVNEGGAGACTSFGDSGCPSNNNSSGAIIFVGFQTPASMTSPSWGSNCFVYWHNPDSVNKNSGCALYDDNSGSGTVTTSGATVTWVSGTQFLSSWATAGANIWIAVGTAGATECTISTVNSATSITLTSSSCVANQASAVGYSVSSVGSKLCSAFSSTAVTNNAWTSYPISSCGTPATSHVYWMGVTLTSTTQVSGQLQVGGPCPNNVPGSAYSLGFAANAFSPLASFTSNASWPSSVATTSKADTGGDSCAAVYIPLTYTTTAPYTFITKVLGGCDSSSTACAYSIAPLQSGDSLIIFANTSSNGAPVTAPSDGASDTFTKIGTCPTVTGGTANWSACWYYVDRPTAGTTAVQCNTTALNKSGCVILEVAGTISTNSADQNCYDSTASTSTTIAGCTSSTTAQATELWLGALIQENTFTSNPWNVPLFTATSPWALLASGGGSAGIPWPGAIESQTTSSTGTCQANGTAPNAGGSPKFFTSCVTFK